MKITSPEDMLLNVSDKVEEAVAKFEEAFKEKEVEKGNNYYFLVIDKEYNRAICDEIEKLYLNAGWGNAICRPSSEGGERPGLTGLKLWVKW